MPGGGDMSGIHPDPDTAEAEAGWSEAVSTGDPSVVAAFARSQIDRRWQMTDPPPLAPLSAPEQPLPPDDAYNATSGQQQAGAAVWAVLVAYLGTLTGAVVLVLAGHPAGIGLFLVAIGFGLQLTLGRP